MDDIKGYSSHIILCDVPLGDLSTLIDFNPAKIDFKDNHLYLLAKIHSATVITDDGDFSDLDMPVGTFNKKLYNKYKDSVRPK